MTLCTQKIRFAFNLCITRFIISNNSTLKVIILLKFIKIIYFSLFMSFVYYNPSIRNFIVVSSRVINNNHELKSFGFEFIRIRFE